MHVAVLVVGLGRLIAMKPFVSDLPADLLKTRGRRFQEAKSSAKAVYPTSASHHFLSIFWALMVVIT